VVTPGIALAQEIQLGVAQVGKRNLDLVAETQLFLDISQAGKGLDHGGDVRTFDLQLHGWPRSMRIPQPSEFHAETKSGQSDF